jgi:hypothetical protein
MEVDRTYASKGRCGVLTAVTVNSYIFWDITPCSPMEVSSVSEQHIASIYKIQAGNLLINPEDGGDMFL